MQLPSDVRPPGELDPVQPEGGGHGGRIPAPMDTSTGQMTEREAWLYLARLWSEAQECPCGCKLIVVVPLGEILSSGLCSAISAMCHVNLISGEVKREMRQKVDNVNKMYTGAYYWPQDLEGAKARAEFCKTQGEQC
jgi:hypothetical protein